MALGARDPWVGHFAEVFHQAHTLALGHAKFLYRLLGGAVVCLLTDLVYADFITSRLGELEFRCDSPVHKGLLL